MLMGRHFQNAYVTRDVDRAVTGFRERADVRKLIETEVSVELWTQQGTGTGVQKLAFVWIEDLQIELIQPISGDVLALYRDALPIDDALNFHHVCHRVADWDVLIESIARQPWPIVLRGGTPGLLEFLYLDTRPWLGHFLEYTWMVPARWAQLGGRA